MVKRPKKKFACTFIGSFLQGVIQQMFIAQLALYVVFELLRPLPLLPECRYAATAGKQLYLIFELLPPLHQLVECRFAAMAGKRLTRRALGHAAERGKGEKGGDGNNNKCRENR